MPIHIDGFPDAVKLIKLTGPKAKRLADLGLHRVDLLFAQECLNAIPGRDSDTEMIVMKSLWRNAVIYYIKCFANADSRGPLSERKIYKGDAMAIEVFNYFKALRHKHYVHDVNDIMQPAIGAVLNNKTKDRKIDQVLTLVFIGEMLGQENGNNLSRLLAEALKYVEDEINLLSNQLSAELEQLPYEQLLDMEQLTYSKPVNDNIAHARRKFPES